MMVKSRVGATLHHRTVAPDGDRRLKRNFQLAFFGEVIGNRDVGASISGPHAIEPEVCRRVYTFSSVGSAQGRFNQDVGQLEAVDGFTPNFQYDCIAYACIAYACGGTRAGCGGGFDMGARYMRPV